MPAMPLDEDKRRDSKRDDAHLGQQIFTPYMYTYLPHTADSPYYYRRLDFRSTRPGA